MICFRYRNSFFIVLCIASLFICIAAVVATVPRRSRGDKKQYSEDEEKQAMLRIVSKVASTETPKVREKRAFYSHKIQDAASRRRNAKRASSQSLGANPNRGVKGEVLFAFLDFDGHYREKAWLGVSGITSVPFNMDADYFSYSHEEERVMNDIVQLVKEDWVIFENIHVVRGNESLLSGKRFIRIVLEGNSEPSMLGTHGAALSEWNSYRRRSRDLEVLAYVYCTQLAYDARDIAAAVSHEMGHIFGLEHQSLWSNIPKVHSSGSPPAAPAIAAHTRYQTPPARRLREYHPGSNTSFPIMGGRYQQPKLPSVWWAGFDPWFQSQNDTSVLLSTLNIRKRDAEARCTHRLVVENLRHSSNVIVAQPEQVTSHVGAECRAYYEIAEGVASMRKREESGMPMHFCDSQHRIPDHTDANNSGASFPLTYPSFHSHETNVAGSGGALQTLLIEGVISWNGDEDAFCFEFLSPVRITLSAGSNLLPRVIINGVDISSSSSSAYWQGSGNVDMIISSRELHCIGSYRVEIESPTP